MTLAIRGLAGRVPQDMILGAIFSAIALIFLSQMQDLPLGSLKRVGAGFLPKIISWALLVIGMVHILRGLGAKGRSFDRSVPMSAWGARGMIGIAAATGFFAMAMAWNAGLLIAGSGTVLLASIATGQGRLVQRGLLVLCVVGGSILLFCLGLGLPIPILPRSWP